MIPSKILFKESKDCVIKIKDALFLKDNKLKHLIFPNSIKAFEIYKPNCKCKPSFWTIIGPEKSKFLNIISGKYIPAPPLSRIYPFISENYKYDKIQFLNFKENSGLDKVHLSARYETYSYKGKLEISDDTNSVKNYIIGTNNYNNTIENINKEYFEKLIKLFNLNHLLNKWINTLSNGQMRRARIVKSLIKKPNLLIIDDPFLGLDLNSINLVSNSLERLCKEFNISIVLGIRIQDKIPDWINNISYINKDGLKFFGEKHKVLPLIENEKIKLNKISKKKKNFKNLIEITNELVCKEKIPHIEFNNASLSYKSLLILRNFSWKIPKGSKWRILGDNGTGKTTILSLITADHPQSWKSVILINGKLRKTGNGSSFFDINNKIGLCSPELHSLVPNNKTMKEIILTGLVNNVGNSNFMSMGKEEDINEFGRFILNKFNDRLNLYGNTKFFDLSITDQKLTLFLRALVKKPELLILDEAFSCMDNEELVIRCHDIIESYLHDMTVLTIGHIDWEVPKCDYLLKLYGDKNRSYKLFKY